MIEVKSKEQEKVILVGISSQSVSSDEAFASLEELHLLVSTAGGEVQAKIIQGRNRVDATFFVGKGKAEYLAELCEKDEVDTIVFDDDLSPVQVRNLENLTKRKIIDRSGIILDIFASHAKTTEAKTQVELAQLEYLLPRLTRRWTHFSKQYGGIGTKGPGETQIETDRRVIRNSIALLKKKLEIITEQKKTQRKLRSNIPRLALVGYTNVGKSTLLNLLSGSHVLTENKLFSTLDTTVRQINITPSRKFLISDTVGFIKKLPHHLIISFMSTLSEVIESDILLHVADITNPKVEEQISVVENTLRDLNCSDKKTIMIFNKIDLLKEKYLISFFESKYENSVFISAARNININQLVESILNIIKFDLKEYSVKLNHTDHKVVSKIHSLSEVIDTKYGEEKITIRFLATTENYKQIREELRINKKNNS